MCTDITTLRLVAVDFCQSLIQELCDSATIQCNGASRQVSRESRKVSIESRNVSIESRKVCIESRQVSIESRQVSIESRKVSIESRKVFLESRKGIPMMLSQRATCFVGDVTQCHSHCRAVGWQNSMISCTG